MNCFQFDVPKNRQTALELAIADLKEQRAASDLVAQHMPLIDLLMKYYTSARARGAFFKVLRPSIITGEVTHKQLLWSAHFMETEVETVRLVCGMPSGTGHAYYHAQLGAHFARLLVALVALNHNDDFWARNNWYMPDAADLGFRMAKIKQIGVLTQTFELPRDIILFLDSIEIMPSVINMPGDWPLVVAAPGAQPRIDRYSSQAIAKGICEQYAARLYATTTRQDMSIISMAASAQSGASVVHSAAPAPPVQAVAPTALVQATAPAVLVVVDARAAKSECTICMNAQPTHAAVPCGHVALCETCATKEQPAQCPVCLGGTQTWMKLFFI